MDRADYAEPILRARAALRIAEEHLMNGRPKAAQEAANDLWQWADALQVVCSAMAAEAAEAQRDA